MLTHDENCRHKRVSNENSQQMDMALRRPQALGIHKLKVRRYSVTTG
jgi:hypothetical protein